MEPSAEIFHLADKRRAAALAPPIRHAVFVHHWPLMKLQRMNNFLFGLRVAGTPASTVDIVNNHRFESVYPSVIVKRPGEVWQCDPETRVETFHFSYEPEAFGFFRRHGLPDDLKVMPLPDMESFDPLLGRLREMLGSSEEFGMADRIDLLGFQFFSEIILQWEKRNSPIGRMDRRIFQAASYLRLHFLEEIDFEDLARRFGFSYRTFVRRWHEAGFRTPAARLFELRMEEARRLLAETDLSVSEIASRLRYRSGAWFCAVFRRVNGRSALAYRRDSRLSRPGKPGA